MDSETLSRRSFLKMAGGGALIATMPKTVYASSNLPYSQTPRNSAPISARVPKHFDPRVLAAEMGSDIFTRRPPYPLHTKLALLFDVSGSIKRDEYIMQKIGTANALRSNRVKTSIQNRGGIALCVHEFSKYRNERISWMVIETAEDADVAATLIETMPELKDRSGTGLSFALSHMPKIMSQCPVDALKSVVDISGDGNDSLASHHSDIAAQAVRYESDQCAKYGITCNGLTMLTDKHSYLPYGVDSVFMLYDQYVKTTPHKFSYSKDYGEGRVFKQFTPGGFVIGINNYQDFEPAMEIKLSYEVAGLSPLLEKTNYPNLMFA